MSDDPKTKPSKDAELFTELAEEEDVGLVREFWDFLRYNKKWWLTPIILVLLLFALVIVLSGSPLMPFIYTMF